MPIDKRVSFADALDGVSDGATVFITGFGGAGFVTPTYDHDAPTLPSTIGDEHATNPFLRAGLASVMSSAAAHARRPMENVIDSFATLRQWKNEFR